MKRTAGSLSPVTVSENAEKVALQNRLMCAGVLRIPETPQTDGWSARAIQSATH
jgi:hypothetical protein